MTQVYNRPSADRQAGPVAPHPSRRSPRPPVDPDGIATLDQLVAGWGSGGRTRRRPADPPSRPPDRCERSCAPLAPVDGRRLAPASRRDAFRCEADRSGGSRIVVCLRSMAPCCMVSSAIAAPTAWAARTLASYVGAGACGRSARDGCRRCRSDAANRPLTRRDAGLCQWRAIERQTNEPEPFTCSATRTGLRAVPLN
jgi:hypothetical protein